MLIYFLIAAVAAALYLMGPTYFYKLLYRIRRRPAGNAIYLTFDDGPSRLYTERLLDLLKKYEVKASFFCVADFAAQNPQIIARMKSEGHLVGLHSLSHGDALFMSAGKSLSDLESSLAIMRSLGADIRFYRPPWGRINLPTMIFLKKRGLKTAMWNVMAEDWRADSSADMINHKLLKRTRPHDIICLHDGRGENEAPSRTVAALEMAIPALLAGGYSFETVDKYYEK